MRAQEHLITTRQTETSIMEMIVTSLKVDAPTINRSVKTLPNSRTHINAMIIGSNRASLGVRITNKDTTTPLHHRLIIASNAVDTISNNKDNHKLIKTTMRLRTPIKATDHSRAETVPGDISNGKLSVEVSRAKEAASQVNRVAVATSDSTHRAQISSSNVPSATNLIRFLDRQTPATAEATVAINHSVQTLNFK